ncbi:hypothetical protein [Mycobacterium ahvazicum]|uniref:hypothetical protein n=1 Tax=Mycobacterium ahvazicum TaxID=1964395 RepID=UPI001A9CAB85
MQRLAAPAIAITTAARARRPEEFVHVIKPDRRLRSCGGRRVLQYLLQLVERIAFGGVEPTRRYLAAIGCDGGEHWGRWCGSADGAALSLFVSRFAVSCRMARRCGSESLLPEKQSCGAASTTASALR